MLMNPLRCKYEGTYRGGEGMTPVTTDLFELSFFVLFANG